MNLEEYKISKETAKLVLYKVTYKKLMNGSFFQKESSIEWMRKGDMFKKFSLYDESKYKISFSSSLK